MAKACGFQHLKVYNSIECELPMSVASHHKAWRIIRCNKHYAGQHIMLREQSTALLAADKPIACTLKLEWARHAHTAEFTWLLFLIFCRHLIPV
jgi:hypothetical protein